MQLFRYMSDKEFNALINGETLKNTTNHKQYGRHTSSIGFCFLNDDEYNPERSLSFLGGIVSEEKCVVFDVDEKLLTKTSGIYADPNGSWFDMMLVTEYCIKRYDKKLFNIVKYATINDNKFIWSAYDEK